MGDKRIGDDDLLVDGLIKGDFRSFEKIYHKYIRELYFLSMGYLNNSPDAQDVVQEAFIYLWNKKELLKPNSNIKSYLRAIVKNASLNVLRDEKIKEKHKVIISGKEGSTSEMFSVNNIHEEQSKSFEAKLSLVRSRLEQLPQGCKKIFIMSVIEGYTYKEVSKKMGISINTVKTQVKIAYQKMRAE